MMPSHISFSQVSSYRQCPRSWYCKSVLKEPQPQTDAASRGSQFDQLIAYKLGLGEAPTDPLMERVEEAAQIYLANGGWTRAKEAQKEIKLTPNAWDFAREIYGVDWTLPVPIIGYVDLVRQDESGLRTELVDIKTSERAEYRPDWGLQCALYSLVLRAFRFEIHLVTFTKKIKLTRYTYRPTDQTFCWAMNIIGHTAEMMKRTATEKIVEKIPATPGYQCRWCGRQTSCEGSLIGGLTGE